MELSTGGGGALSLSVADDGLYAAHINGKDLIVYSEPTSEHKETQTARVKETGVRVLKFCPKRSSNSGRYLLSANEARISVWQLDPLQLFAEIENIEPGSLSVEFGSDEHEVLVFHAWNTKVSIHSLETGRISVIKSPKSAHHLGFGYRPRTKQLAILLKPEATDVLTIHEPKSYDLVNRAVLSTIDAQGLKWSPDGRWIAVWDTAILIFTADGQLFRTYTGRSAEDAAYDLGVKQIEWSLPNPTGESEVLAVGKVNGTIDLLRTRTFSCSTTLTHSFSADTSSPSIWRERFTSAMGDADYAETSSSSAFNMSPESSGPLRGVSSMTFSPGGTYLATVDSMRSNVVWIWAMGTTPRLESALVHEQPVRQIAWHRSAHQLLINTISNTLPAVRCWSPHTQPIIVRVPTKKNDNGKYEVKWLSGSNQKSEFWFGSTEEFVVGYLSTDDDGLCHFEVLNSMTNRGYGSHAGSLSR
ncbi:hypothetical protein N7470_003774 [Penicillium chermesinum]|nr:hypothetical protein N7470_003774 [Penicillium chermesinum]